MTSSDPVAELREREFPKYYVSRPPDDLGDAGPVYYKLLSPDGPVFWRKQGDDAGRELSFYDLLMEEKNGFGIDELDKGETPWGNQ